MEQWRQFHCDIKDVTTWLEEVEAKLSDTKNEDETLNVQAAMAIQKVGCKNYRPVLLIIIVVFDFSQYYLKS